MSIWPLIAVLSLFACTEEVEPVDVGEPVPELPVPDLADIDFETALQDAMRIAIKTDLRSAWSAHRDSMDLLQTGCPDLYAGPPEPDMDEIDMDAPGVSWADHCATGGGREFGGFVYWESGLAVDGDVTTTAGGTSTATRQIIGDGTITDADTVLFEFDGNGSDSVTLFEADGFSRFTYSSLVDATVTGSMVTDAGATGDLRTDMYLFYTGGDADTLEVRGNVYFFDHRIQTRFDSLHVDVAFASPASTPPEGCALEPSGFISIRDENAFWYDLVFEPRYDADATDEDYENDPYSECDGCGTVYVRGLEQPGIEVCPDFDFLWDGGTLVPPAVEDYALSMRDVFEEDP